MAKGGRKTTQTTRSQLDPESQRYVRGTREMAAGFADQIADGQFYLGPETMSIADQAAPFINYAQLNALDAAAERGGEQVRGAAGAAATHAGAFGGARHGALEAVGMGEINRNLMAGRADAFNNALNMGIGYQAQQRQLLQQKMLEPIMRAQTALQLRSGGLGPTGSTSTQVTKQPGPSLLGQVAGLATTAAGFLNPATAPLALGSKIGSSFLGGGRSPGPNELSNFQSGSGILQPGQSYFGSYY